MSEQDNTIHSSEEEPKEKDQSPPPRSLSWPLSLFSFSCMAFCLLFGLLAELLNLADSFMILWMIFLLAGICCGVVAPMVFAVDLFRILAREVPPAASVQRLFHAVLLWIGALAIYFGPIENGLFNDRPPTVARVKGDQRTLTIALETYYLDNNAYPAWSARREENAFAGLRDKKGILAGMPTFRQQNGSALATLTTPVTYVTSLFSDPLSPVKDAPFCYWTCNAKNTTETGYIIWSAGPDGIYDLTMANIARAYDPAAHVPSPYLVDHTYDPSNGTASRGDVYRYKQ